MSKYMPRMTPQSSTRITISPPVAAGRGGGGDKLAAGEYLTTWTAGINRWSSAHGAARRSAGDSGRIGRRPATSGDGGRRQAPVAERRLRGVM